MDNILTNTRQMYLEYFVEFYREHDHETIIHIRDIIAPVADQVAATFYCVMMRRETTQPFLNHDLVQTRLLASLTNWVRDLFQLRQNTDEIYHLIDRQLDIGRVHARMNIPPHVMSEGIRVIKAEIGARLRQAGLPRDLLGGALQSAYKLVDIIVSLINESYFHDLIHTARQSQILQTQIIGHDFAIRCERLRADVFDWLRRILTLLYQNEEITDGMLPSLASSDFGLWLTHKADLFYPDVNEVKELAITMLKVDNCLAQAVDSRRSGITPLFSATIEQLNNNISHISYMLSALAEQSSELDNARDILTKLFNRRYLDFVMQRETRYSIQHGSRYAVMMVDIDDFKSVNDTYGHDIGDKVLTHAAELLHSNVRAGDFVFRYGGEEFLIVLTDINMDATEQLASNLVAGFAAHGFYIGLESPLTVTVSIGVACHNGHPDYALVIKAADDALYRAKQEGRNRYVLAAGQ